MNHYVVLGILPNATPEEVRQAYLKLAKMYHPDKNRSPDATIRMAEINLAYEVLRDVQRRKEYDLENEIAKIDNVGEEQLDDFEEEDDEIGQEEWSPGRCVRCNFVNNSGMFVCSVCGHVFDPYAKGKKDSYSDDDIGYGELDDPEDTLSEIIRCPRCNEINRYSRGSCWQCGLEFEMEELV